MVPAHSAAGPAVAGHYHCIEHYILLAMYKKLNDLQFIIGLFFFVVSLILLVSALINDNMAGKLNIYTGIIFLVFGLAMMFIRKR